MRSSAIPSSSASPLDVEAVRERFPALACGAAYALEPIRALGLAETGGAVRAGFLHYTSDGEVDRLLAALAA